MSNNKKGKSLRKILTTAYTAVLIGASGMVVADTLFISKSLAKFSNETTTTASSNTSNTSSTPTMSTATAYETIQNPSRLRRTSKITRKSTSQR